MSEYYTFGEYIKVHELTPSEEDYVEMIYRLQLQDTHVKVAQLAQSLNVKPPSASKMVKQLQCKDLLIHENYGNLVLNDKGKKIGKSLLLRHNTIESFLKLIGLQNNLHEETEKIEHTINEETLDNILKLVKFFDDNPIILSKYIHYCKD